MNRKNLHSVACVCLILMLAATTAHAQTYLFINKWGSPGAGDGQFRWGEGAALDASGNVYVIDASERRIQKFTSGGTFITKWGTTGTGDGQFDWPCGVAVDSSDNVYVADTENDRIQKFTSNGTFLSKWGSSGAGEGQFNYPTSVAVDGSDNVYVADKDNSRIQKFTSDGTFITQWGSWGAGDGQFYTPRDMTVDATGNVYVTEYYRIQKFTSDGTFITKWGSQGTDDGQFWGAFGMAVDGSDNVYVADNGNHRIQKFTSDGTFITKWGSLGAGDGQLNKPTDMAIDGSDNVYVVDNYNSRIQVFEPNYPPTAPTVTILPASPTSDASLRATTAGSADPESDPISYSYQWYKDGALQPGRIYRSLGARWTRGGETWRCVVTPNDGFQDGPSGEDTVTLNTPPTAPTVTIMPTSPTTHDSLRATTAGSTDADGDPISYSYQWHKDGVLQPSRIYRSLGARWTRGGETWRCVVTPNDGIEDGPTTEDSVTVNTPPTAPTVTIMPTSPTTHDSLRATTAGSADADGDPISYSYQWYKDGALQPGRIYRSLGARWTRAGEAWRCVVTPGDGIEDGPTTEDSVTINTPPTAPTVVMAPAAPTTADSFKATVSSTDADGDPISYAYQWYKNGIEQTSVTWPTIGAWRTRAGQTWKCVVTPSDLHGAGPTGEATVVIASKGGPLTVSGLAALPTARGAEVAFTLSADAAVTCEVLNIAGRAVKTIVADRPMAEGINSLAWDGSNASGLRAPAGVYLVRMTATTEEGLRWTSMGILKQMR